MLGVLTCGAWSAMLVLWQFDWLGQGSTTTSAISLDMDIYVVSIKLLVPVEHPRYKKRVRQNREVVKVSPVTRHRGFAR